MNNSLNSFEAKRCETLSYNGVPIEFGLSSGVLSLQQSASPSVSKGMFRIDGGLVVTNEERRIVKISQETEQWLYTVLGADANSLRFKNWGIGQSVGLGDSKIQTIVFLKSVSIGYTVNQEQREFLFETTFFNTV